MKKESFIYSTLTIGGSKEQVNEVMKYICDDIYDIGSIDLNKICAVPVHLNIGPDDEVSCGEKLYRTRVPLRAFDSYMLKTVEFDDKVIAFHASAVECGGKAYVFLARSGAGKTTLCAYLTAHGFGYITEDCVLIDRETLRVYPYTAPLRLRPGGITALEAAGVCLPPLKRMLEGELFRYIYEPDNPVEKPLELGGIYFILRTLNMNAAIDMTGTTKMHQLMLSPMIPYPVDGEFLRLMTKIGSVPCRNLVYKDMNYAAEVLENA